MSDKTYYICVNCQMQFSKKVAEHNDFECSSCSKELVLKDEFPTDKK